MRPATRRSLRVVTPSCAITALAFALACGKPEGPRPPESRVALVADTLHGVVVEDRYRWLEDQSSDEVLRWIDAQQRYADSVMGPEHPLRDSLRTRLTALLDVPAIGVPRRAGQWEYFTLRRRGEPVGSIYRRPASDVPGRIHAESSYAKVLDPLTIRDDGTTSVGIEALSNDGRLLVYSVRDGGPDEIAIRVRDVTEGRDLPDSLPAALYASISMPPHGRGFYYVHRSRSEGPRYRYHQLGTDVRADSLIFGEGYAPTAFLNVSSGAGGRYRLFTVGHGWARNEVHVQDTRRGSITEITRGLDAHFTPQFSGDRLLMRTDHDAPRGRIVAVDLADPAPERWQTVVPEGEHTLDAFSTIDGRLFVTWIHDVSHRITVHERNGTRTGEIALPPYVSATLRPAGRGRAHLTITSFVQPPTTWLLDLATGARELWEAPDVPFDTASAEVQQHWYTSADGTRAPLYVVRRRGAERSPTTPALLSGYGGFAVSLMPRFDGRAAAWVERGGIFVQATLRGGNEFGELWHRAGMLQNKQRVFDDFLAAAQFLVDSGFTSPAHLAIRGGSNGGLLMGAAITQRPELFRAAFVGVPDLDMVRFPAFTSHNNMPALLEYGDATRQEEFEAIMKYSPYQNVRDGVRYPAVFVQTGMNDTRVPPWQARRFTARLQAAARSGEPVILDHDLRSGHAGGRPIAGTIELATKELEFLWTRVR